jgi:hypothetical protein
MHKKDRLGPEHRKYIRLDSVFPVSIRLLSLDGSKKLSDWLQGFTNNIGKGGLCLVINNLKPELARLLKGQEVRLSLEIEIPLNKKPVSALAKVIWIRELDSHSQKYIIGLGYAEIEYSQNKRIIHYARTKQLFLPLILTIIFILGFGFAINAYMNIKLTKGNKALVEQLVKIIQESHAAKGKIKKINREKSDLQFKIQELQLKIHSAQKEKADLEKVNKLEKEEADKKIAEFNNLIEQLTKKKTPLQNELLALQRKENAVSEELLSLGQKKVQLEKANLDKMYQWLKLHQNPRTGLIMSFEGDADIANWAFTYDQSLVAQAYTYFGDFERARKILDFFAKKAKKVNGAFLNAYYVNDGLPAEYAVHSGPNIWLGIAVLQYSKKSQDYQYLGLAEEIASTIINLQNQDSDGGIRGGPDMPWYATEHNLDAYAFFNMLYKLTHKKLYLSAQDKTLQWLVKHTYDREDIPIKRGKGDATIATDTYAWSLAAIGPEKIEEVGMNPDKILEFAEDNCLVEVIYQRPEGQAVKIKGFDFAAQRHLARGGIVSSEWTAQMILAFKIMADFYHKKGISSKADVYAAKANEYMAELASMLISSPSPSGQGESCLPYATQDAADTGHGWITPKGKSTGSLSGTSYTLFAYYGYNPLGF